MLILLEKGSSILNEVALNAFKQIIEGDEHTEEKSQVSPIECKFCDFDGAHLKVLIDPDNRTKMSIALYIPCWDDLAALGATDYLNEVYGKLIDANAVKEYNYSLTVDLENIPKDYKKFAETLSCFKANAVAAPFILYFRALNEGKVLEAGQINLTNETTIYFSMKKDRVVVIYSLHFNEKADKVIANQFLTGLKNEGKKMGQAPIVSFDFNPPNELKNEFGIEEPIGNVGFVSFAILKNHVSTPAKIEKVAHIICTYRNYLEYHIKCSKTYFNAHMRKRVKELLLVLNRAKSVDEEQNKKKKTATGRIFTRS